MDVAGSRHLTAQQIKWFAALAEGLQRETGRTLDEWVLIARTCPEAGHRAKLRWFKETFGLLQNRASYVLSHAGSNAPSWSEPDRLRDLLWTDGQGRRILERIEANVLRLDGVVPGQRKAFCAWSRRVQFAALRPKGTGAAFLGLAVPVEAFCGLAPRGTESWSERLKSKIELRAPEDVTPQIARLLEAAWDAS